MRKSEEIVQSLNKDGYCVYPGFITRSECNTLVQEFEEVLQDQPEQVWRDNDNSDERIFGLEMFSKKVGDVFKDDLLRGVIKDYLGVEGIYSFVMGNRLTFRRNNAGSGGGWHRDTYFTRQLKFIIYLSPVSENCGPFEYVPGSHKVSSKLKDMPKQIIKGNYRRYEKANSEVATLCGEPGDLIIVDTSGVHRGRPLVSGNRYALTNYLSVSSFGSSVLNELPDNFKVQELVL